MNQRRILLGISLFTLIFSLYVLSFNGQFISTDERLIFDSTESLVQRGNTSMNYAFSNIGLGKSQRGAEWNVPIAEICTAVGGDPWQSAKYEPFNFIALAPFSFIALQLPNAGNISIILFFNIFVTALTAVSIYGLGVRRGYADRSAWLTALLFAVGTIAWFYARQIYREPFSGFFVLWAFGLASYYKDYWSHERQSKTWLILLILSIAGFIATKLVLVILVPGVLLTITLPPKKWMHRQTLIRVGLIALLCAVLVGVAITVSETGVFGNRLHINTDKLNQRLGNPLQDGYVLEGLLGYHISPARSVWLYSPILLLGLYGVYLLWKEKKRQLVIGLALSLVGTGYFYGWFRGAGWHGAWGWGPRYFVPLIPVVMLLWVMPAIDKLLQKRWGTGLVASVGLASVLLQLSGLAVPIGNFYTDAFNAGQYHEHTTHPDYPDNDKHWQGANWSPEWMPALYHIEHVDFDYLNVAWVNTENKALPLSLALGLALLSGGGAFWLMHNQKTLPDRSAWVGLSGAIVLILFTTGTAVKALENDSRYSNSDNPTRRLIADLNASVDSDAIILLSQAQSTDLFMQFYKESATIVTLPTSPAEFGLDATLADSIDVQIGAGTACAIEWSSQNSSELWLITDATPFMIENLRPIERYLAAQYFSVSDTSYADNLRLVRFVSTQAPLEIEPSIALDIEVGEQLNLIGIDLPAGAKFQAGDGVPLSLVWQPLQILANSYNVGVYLLNADGVVQTQRDTQPQGTFGDMQTWEVGTVYRDNHGLVLPDDLPAGTYSLVAKVYRWEDGVALPLSNGIGEGDIISLATIEVAQ